MFFQARKIHFKINNEKQKLMISKFVFQPKTCNQVLHFNDKIQNSILGQKSQITIFSIFISILN